MIKEINKPFAEPLLSVRFGLINEMDFAFNLAVTHESIVICSDAIGRIVGLPSSCAACWRKMLDLRGGMHKSAANPATH